MKKNLRIVELFAGVGGFRIGLEAASDNKTNYSTVWANQWEPSTKTQHAAAIYSARFGKEGFVCENIEKIIEEDFKSIPYHDVLVGGFPCQDYSVASTLKRSRGLIGKKGVLFWSIYTILKRQGENAPDYLFLENVDRLLKSPASQRGKDFAIMLTMLSSLGYAIEWRVINAADYGFPQRRRRVFILGYKKGTKLYEKIKETNENDRIKWLTHDGVLQDAFPTEKEPANVRQIPIKGTPVEITEHFSEQMPKISPFDMAGVMIDRKVTTARLTPSYDGERLTLGDIVNQNDDEIPSEYFIPENQLHTWKEMKGAKKVPRKTATGHEYLFSEGAIAFPEPLDKPSRTIITGEGGSSPSRIKHVIKTNSGKYRRLTPTELEKLDMFPPEHTALEGVTATKRAFILGNALVVGAIQRVGESLSKMR